MQSNGVCNFKWFYHPMHLQKSVLHSVPIILHYRVVVVVVVARPPDKFLAAKGKCNKNYLDLIIAAALS